MNKLLLFCIILFISSSCQQENVESVNKENKKVENVTIKNSKAELLFQTKTLLGEGAFWNNDDKKLYWVDINANQANIYNPATKTNQVFTAPSQVGTIVPIDGDEVMLALQDGPHILNVSSGEITPFMLVDHGGKNVRFNDGKADPSGRLWVGTLDMNLSDPIGRVYMFDKIGNIVEQDLEVTISNGIVWNKAKDKMYYIDTPTQKIVAFDYNDATGEISNQTTVANIDKSLGSPDGMAIDEHDNLWVGMWNGNAVLCFDSTTGNVIHKIDVPAHNVTSCAFGGPNLETLYITTSTEDMTEEEKEQYPLAGSLFVAKPGVRGVITQHFVKE